METGPEEKKPWVKNNVQPTQLELDALSWLLAGDDPVLVALRSQLDKVESFTRHYTVVGFFLNMILPEDVSGVDKLYAVRSRIILGDLGGRFTSTATDFGLILFVSEGRISTLEGYMLGDPPFPEPPHILDYELYYYRAKRDLDELKNNWALDE